MVLDDKNSKSALKDWEFLASLGSGNFMHAFIHSFPQEMIPACLLVEFGCPSSRDSQPKTHINQTSCYNVNRDL